MKVLVVDDSRAMRSILRKTLGDLGFESTEAGDGEQGFNLLVAQGPFDLALVDWNMPLLNGYELVKKIRADHTFDALKIVMVTTEVETSQVCKALEAGANEYIMKPFTPEVLRDKLQSLTV